MKHEGTILGKLRKQGSSPEASQSQSPRSKAAPASLAALRSQGSKDAVSRLTQSKVPNSVPPLLAAQLEEDVSSLGKSNNRHRRPCDGACHIVCCPF